MKTRNKIITNHYTPWRFNAKDIKISFVDTTDLFPGSKLEQVGSSHGVLKKIDRLKGM